MQKLINAADNNRADWEKKKTNEIHQVEQKKASEEAHKKLREENEVLKK